MTNAVRTERVELGDRSYDVTVGHGAAATLAAMLPASARRVAIVTQRSVPFDVSRFVGSDHRVSVHLIGEGETHKSLATIETLSREFARAGITRNDVIVGVGGGMVTDVAGFAAASWHRGTAVVHVATTLVGMVDAAIGGKTGVNVPEGKNLVGAFWQPRGVVCDLDALATLPDREVRCGNGEMAKYHFLTGDDLQSMDLAERIARCVRIKADIVGSDERESGRRALLNYGHTLAHALETTTNHDLAHGEAVAIGLMYAAHLARELGRIDDVRVAHHRSVIADGYGLSVRLPDGASHEALVDVMARDKKALDGLTFVLDGSRGVEVVSNVPRDAVLSALAAM
ncbi:MAG: 3-dehydroquinate synthase family protein [Ilumatobacteraceae bacterium]